MKVSLPAVRRNPGAEVVEVDGKDEDCGFKNRTVVT